MEFDISNGSVSERIVSCLDEFFKIKSIIDGVGAMSHPVPYLTRYSIIRACGAIEFGFKTIISDVNSESQSNQVKNFIDKKFRNSSMNPSYSNICRSLASFDDSWSQNFKNEMAGKEHKNRIMDSLDSLNQARNAFAHGGSPSTSFANVEKYFEDSVVVLECIERAVNP
ncbi:MAG: HEPN domain-containing protein [Cellvibrionaceae bacterium]